MDGKQIIDILPSYISLYSNPNPNPNPNPTQDRSTILKWFTTLSPPQRVAHLTIVDPTFTQLLLRMLPLSRHSHVTFFLLPDIPSSSPRDPVPLPSLLSRSSRGLLSRLATLSPLSSSLLLFSSSSSATTSSLDTVSYRESFVANVDDFVRTMDAVSGGGFLNGPGEEWGEIGGDIVEFGWLKAKGYFTLEEFVANRVELAMRMAWLSASGGRGKRGVKVKEKEKEKARNAVGLGVNVYWRKKGCVDWWARLGSEVRRKVFRTVLGKAAKTMTGEIMKGTDGILEDNLLHFDSGAKQYSRTSYQGSSSKSTRELIQRRAEFGLSANLISSGSKRSSPLACAINRLIVLQAITAMVLASSHDDFDSEKIFFSSLDSVNTISDAILRKLRGLLMVVYLESTKFELLAEESKKIEPNKSKEKSTSIHRKKKGKTRNSKKSSTASNDCVDGLVPEKTLEDSESGSTCLRQMDGTLDEVGRVNSADKGEKVQKLATERLQTSATKKGKQHKKKKLHGRVDNSSDVCIPSPRMQMTLSSCSTAGYGKEQSTVGQSLTVLNKGPKDSAIGCHNEEQSLAPCNCEFRSKDDNLFGSEPRNLVASVKGGHDAWGDSNPSLDNKKNGEVLSKVENVDHSVDCGIASVAVTTGECPRFHEADCDKDHAVVKAGEFQGVKNHGECYKDRIASQTVATPFLYRKSLDVKKEPVLVPDSDNQARYNGPPVIPVCYPSYEWPAVAPFRLASFNSHIPPATDRLHLEVGHNWQNHFQHSLIQRMHQANPSMDGRIGRIISQPLPASLDRPPILRTCRYDSTLISRKQTTAQGFAAHSPCKSAVSNEEERKFPIDCYELSEPLSTQEFADEYDSHWVSEEECEVHAVSGIDYNQHFGGGVMYWNPSDYRGTGFSRPPSLSSDDSSWAWREADMNQTVDDMVAFSSSYSTNGLNSPSAAPFCSPFESMPPGHQPIGYVRSGNEGKMVPNSSTMMDLEVEENGPGSLASVPSDSDAKSGDSLPYPILRPIIIPNMSRERSRSEFKGNHELRSPRLPLSRRDHPRIKRPPSPVVLCVPRAPRPPPPSPVGDSKKHRGFPTVRSGSSSPRHWGVRGWFHDGANFDESRVLVEGTEVVWPSWRSTNFSAPQLVQPLPGAILQDRLIAISQLTHDQEHPDVALPLLPPELLDCSTQKASLPLIYNLLHEEIDSFCKQVAAENLIRRPYVNWAVKRVTRSLQVLWPRSRTNIFGSNASGLSLPTSDVDLVVCLPPVRNLEPIKEAGILEGRNSIKETCLQHAARYLGNQEWVKADSLKTVENTAIPIIMLVVDVPHDLVTAPAMSNGHISSSEKHKVDPGQNVDRNDVAGSDHSPSPIGSELPNRNKGSISVRLDISFKSPSHTGLQTTELVKQLTDQFPAAIPLALVLKKFLADRSLDQSYSGGLSSYCLVLLITRFLQHEHHHGRPISQNIGSLFMDFLYFFGNVFDPRQMRISIQGSGLYINRERGYSIDPIYIDDPLYPTNNVGRNCFRIHQCIKAFADAYSTLENELSCLASEGDESTTPPNQLLPKIIPSLNVSSSQANNLVSQ